VRDHQVWPHRANHAHGRIRAQILTDQSGQRHVFAQAEKGKLAITDIDVFPPLIVVIVVIEIKA
jgi:hypothetical protein